MAFVADLYDDEVLTLFQLVSYVEVERSEAADMVSHMASVHIDVSIVVDSSEVEQFASTFFQS